jgi:hypothetical protein
VQGVQGQILQSAGVSNVFCKLGLCSFDDDHYRRADAYGMVEHIKINVSSLQTVAKALDNTQLFVPWSTGVMEKWSIGLKKSLRFSFFRPFVNNTS